jgi:malonate-semialdehyde dehydrogenase (acetylating)/methylmalonate-semialdehyde dehydrogenase
MKVGPGTAPGMDMGPLVTKPHFEKVKAYVDQGVAEGATLVVDGRGLTVPGHENGYFLGPCLFDQVKPGMVIYRRKSSARCWGWCGWPACRTRWR